MYKVIEITNKDSIKKFVTFPGRIVFKKKDLWVPPLISEEIKRFDAKKNEFFRYGKAKLFAAIDKNGKWAGRIACFINERYIDKYKKQEGFFGFFDVINSLKVTRVLFQAVAEEFLKNNISNIIGPINFSTNEESGLLIDGFDVPPTFMTNYAKPYYQQLITECGFTKLTDLYAFEWNSGYVFPDSFYRITEKVKNRNTLKIRNFDKNNFTKEINSLWPVYNESFNDVWGFTPLTKTEFNELGNSFKLFADYDLIWVAESAGKVIGFSLVLPDINLLLKKINGRLFPFGIITLLSQIKKIKNLRLNVMAVLPAYRNSGVAALFIDQSVKTARKKGYQKGELSVVLESNTEMMRLLNHLGFKPVRTFRVYSKPVENLKIISS